MDLQFSSYAGYAFEPDFFENINFWYFTDDGVLDVTAEGLHLSGKNKDLWIGYEMIQSAALTFKDPGFWKFEFFGEVIILGIGFLLYGFLISHVGIIEMIISIVILLAYFGLTYLSHFRSSWIKIDFVNPDPVPTIYLSYTWNTSPFARFWRYRTGGSILANQQNEQIFSILQANSSNPSFWRSRI